MKPATDRPREIFHPYLGRIATHDLEIAMIPQIEIVSATGWENDRVPVICINLHDLIEQRSRQVLEPTGQPGKHPAHIERHTHGLFPAAGYERTKMIVISLGDPLGIVKSFHNFTAALTQPIPEPGVAQSPNYCFCQSGGAIGNREVLSFGIGEAFGSDAGGNNTLSHGPSFQNLVPDPRAEA